MKEMRRISVMALLLLLLPCLAMAQDFSWAGDAPNKYLPSATKQIVSRESPCNQGGEAFMDFIPRFRTDAAFRASRDRIPAEDQEIGLTLETLGDCNEGNGFALLKAKKTRLYYCTWYDVSENQVLFQFADTPPENAEWGGGCILARFQRIDGKWYITGLMMAG